jgi:sec-independent protein translocase protein TatA
MEPTDANPGFALIAEAGRILIMGELLQPTHLLVVLAIALIIFGPSKLPGLGKGLGEGLRGFKDGIKGSPDAVKNEDAANVSVTPKPTPTPEVK